MIFFIAINVFLEKNSKRSNFYKNQNFTKRITPQCSPMIILYVVNFCAHKIRTPCIYLYIYKKLSPKWKICHEQIIIKKWGAKGFHRGY